VVMENNRIINEKLRRIKYDIRIAKGALKFAM
jgi:hypothetical protein